MTEYQKCLKCDEPCDVIEIDVGCYENFWGAQVWHAQYDDASDCCQAEIEIIEEDE